MNSMKELLPPNLQGDKNVEALCEAGDHVFQLERELYRLLIYPRIDQIDDENLLSSLAWQFHLEGYDLAQTIEEKKAFVKSAIELHRYKGTPYAIRKIFSLLNIQAEVVEWFDTEGLLPPYTFAILLSPAQIQPIKLIELVNEYKNIRSHLYQITTEQGLCKNIARSDITSYDTALWDDLEGYDIQGVRVCLAFPYGFATAAPKPIYTKATRIAKDIAVPYPFGAHHDQTRFDFPSYDALSIENTILKDIFARIVPEAHFQKAFSTYKDEVSDEGVYWDEGAGFIGEEFFLPEDIYFDNESFDSQSRSVYVLLFFPYTFGTISPASAPKPIYTKATRIAKDIVLTYPYSALFDDVACDKDKDALYPFAVSSSSQEILSHSLKRTWLGAWKGHWRDDYILSAKLMEV